MYKEYELVFPRFDIIFDEAARRLFGELLALLDIGIDMEWLENKFDEYNTGEGDIFVFHNAVDMECFVLLDCFWDYTDQLDFALIGIRVHEKFAAEAKTALKNLAGTYWCEDSLEPVKELYGNELKLKSENYENFVLINALKEIEEYRRKLESQNTINLTYRSTGNKEWLERKRKIELQKHQPVFHYADKIKLE